MHIRDIINIKIQKAHDTPNYTITITIDTLDFSTHFDEEPDDWKRLQASIRSIMPKVLFDLTMEKNTQIPPSANLTSEFRSQSCYISITGAENFTRFVLPSCIQAIRNCSMRPKEKVECICQLICQANSLIKESRSPEALKCLVHEIKEFSSLLKEHSDELDKTIKEIEYEHITQSIAQRSGFLIHGYFRKIDPDKKVLKPITKATQDTLLGKELESLAKKLTKKSSLLICGYFREIDPNKQVTEPVEKVTQNILLERN